MLRLTRPDDKSNRTISETSVNGVIPSGQWHHMAVNFKDTILNKHSAVVQVSVWIDGWKEITAQLPFDGLLIRKPGTTCVLVGQVGASNVGRWDLSNLMIFRYHIWNHNFSDILKENSTNEIFIFPDVQFLTVREHCILLV